MNPDLEKKITQMVLKATVQAWLEFFLQTKCEY